MTSLGVSADGQLHQMLHKRLQTDIVGEDCLRVLAHTTVCAAGRVRGRRVKLREQETCLGTARITDDKSR